MPGTPKHPKAYTKTKKLRAGVGFPLARLMVGFSLAIGMVLEAV